MRSIAQSSKRSFAAAETWRILTLSTEDARHLSDEMRALLEKYASRNGDSWLAHFALCSNPGGQKEGQREPQGYERTLKLVDERQSGSRPPSG
jgi:hypothetical protein